MSENQAMQDRQRLREDAGGRAITPNGAPYPLRSWPPDTAIDIQNLATWVDTNTFSVFANAAARDAAIPSPVEGQSCYLIDVKQGQARDSGGWFPAWGTMPGALITFAGPASVGAATWTALKGGTPTLSAGITYNSTTGLFTLPVAGTYLINVTVEGTGNAAVKAGFNLNGAFAAAGTFGGGSTVGVASTVVLTMRVAAAATITGVAWCQSAMNCYGLCSINWVGR